MTTKHGMTNGVIPRPTDAPSPEVQPALKRPARSAAERLRIVEEYDSYPPGAPERGAILRREGIYTSHISKWRKLRTKGALAALTAQPPGPKPAPRDPLREEVERLRTENALLQARLVQAETIIDVQKNRQGNSPVLWVVSAQRASSPAKNCARR